MVATHVLMFLGLLLPPLGSSHGDMTAAGFSFCGTGAAPGHADTYSRWIESSELGRVRVNALPRDGKVVAYYVQTKWSQNEVKRRLLEMGACRALRGGRFECSSKGSGSVQVRVCGNDFVLYAKTSSVTGIVQVETCGS